MVHCIPFHTNVIFITLSPIDSYGQNGTLVDLHNYLFKSYVKDVRPVLNCSTVTNVTYRVALRSLLSMVNLKRVTKSTFSE